MTYSNQVLPLKTKKKKQDTVLKVTEKKRLNLKTFDMIKPYLSYMNAHYFFECGSFINYITTQDKEYKKVVKINSCKNRFCPNCAYRKSLKDAVQLSIVMQAIKTELSKDFLFLTLTTPNIKADSVQDEINHFNRSFDRMFKRARIKDSIKGYARKLEMTYNAERDDYNPHFHVLLVVDKSYFTNPRRYIPQEEWLEMWREATDMPEIMQVNIKRVGKIKDKDGEFGKAVQEMAKYAAKDTDMTESERVFDVFYNSLKGRRVMVFGGLMKEYIAKYKNKELEQYKTEDMNEYVFALETKWNNELRKYAENYRKLTPEEFEKFNKRL